MYYSGIRAFQDGPFGKSIDYLPFSRVVSGESGPGRAANAFERIFMQRIFI